MTRLPILSGISLLVCAICILVIYLWPTRDWVGGPLIGMFFYLPVVIIEGILLFFCIFLQQGRRFIVTVQGLLAVTCVVLLVYYIVNHQR
jgi:hypothetical protein